MTSILRIVCDGSPSTGNKQLRIIDEKNQYNMQTAEEKASLALVFCKKSALFQQFFSSKKST